MLQPETIGITCKRQWRRLAQGEERFYRRTAVKIVVQFLYHSSERANQPRGDKMQITISPTTANVKFGGKQKFTASEPGVFSIQTEIGSTIDKDGNYTAGQPQLVDAGGQRVNAAGQPVNTAGQPVNAAGQPVDASGQPIAGRVNASGQQVDAAGQIIAGQPVPAGQRVNAAGQPVNDAGQVIPASQPV